MRAMERNCELCGGKKQAPQGLQAKRPSFRRPETKKAQTVLGGRIILRLHAENADNAVVF